MTIATRFPKSWSVPKFDIKDPSLELYLPLWYPYSDMTGATIYSYDTNRHVGTVTGATWGSEGRTFDGNDEISMGSPAILDLRGVDYTMIVWTKPVTPTDAYTTFFQDGNYNVEFGIASVTMTLESWVNNANNMNSVGALTNTKFYHCAMTHTVAGGRTLYIDAVADGTSGAVTQTTYTDMTVGEIYKGVIGEAYIYVGRAFSQSELATHRQVTKWRYS